MSESLNNASAVLVLFVIGSWQGHTASVAQHVAAGIVSQGGNALLRTADEATGAR